VKDDLVIVFFDHAGGLQAGVKDGLAPLRPAPALNGFAIAGADKKWYQADAYIADDAVVLHNYQVRNPVAVRYAYADNPSGANLYNKAGLPAVPFRTDAW
jgi:sialate O-acetylesterase